MLELFLGVLITWRLAALVTSERGPFASLEKFRDWIGVYAELEPGKGAVCQGRSEIAKALCCFWCTSIYAAALVVLLMQAPVLNLFAYSAGAIILWEMVNAE